MHQRADHLQKWFSAARRYRRNPRRIRGFAGSSQRCEDSPSGDSPMKTRLPVRRAILDRQTYEAPGEGRAGKIRLDFNVNTSGCSEAVRRAISKIPAKKLAMYPEYAAPTKRLARLLGVR